MLTIFKKIFPEKINAKPQFNFPEKQMDEVIQQNRQSLNLIDNWIDDEAFKKSFFKQK